MTKDDELDPRWVGASIRFDHWHFHRRLLERYNIILAPGEFSKMVNEILDGRAMVIKRKANGTAIYSVRIERVWERIYVVANGKQTITVLPASKHLNELRRKIIKRKLQAEVLPVSNHQIGTK